MFAQTLTLKGPVPPIVYGRIKPRRNAIGAVVYAFVEIKAPPVPSEMEEMLARTAIMPTRAFHHLSSEMRVHCWGRDDHWLQDVENEIPPRLKAKLEDRPTSDIDRNESYRRWRSTCYRSWKRRRTTQHHLAG